MERTAIILILLLPLVGFLVPALAGKRQTARLAGPLTTGLMAIVTGLAFSLAFHYFGAGPGPSGYQVIVPLKYSWLEFYPGMEIVMGVQLDALSVFMLVVVSFVSLMVHLFSLSYLKGAERIATYFSYLSLFSFSMLALVLSVNIFQLYIFWELVGLSSFLLIGFYYQKPAAVAAAKKAFVITRFADLGLLIGILLLSFQAQTLDFGLLISRLSNPDTVYYQQAMAAAVFGIPLLTLGLVLVFIGGAGKSALFPLHVWLPDAMEGPTPVSALIHAATMVVAGVFLVARLFPIFELQQAVMQLITYTGLFSSLFAAVIACTQTDIKRILAYSTMSQIGFMMFGLGVSGYGGEAGLGYTAALFHLFTHAMFKALLFLGAGSVIHAVHSNEMNAMGGLRRQLPLTHFFFLTGCLAIAGVPFLSGFFSKEEILLAAFRANKFVYGAALLISGLTAFYIFRLYFGIFWYRKPADRVGAEKGNNEGGWKALLPLGLLSIAAIGAGYLPFGKWVSSDGKPLISEFHWQFSILPVALAALGIGIATYRFKTAGDNAGFGQPQPWYKWAYRKFYIDECYLFITRKIIFRAIAGPIAWFDRNIVDGMVRTTGTGTQWIAERIKGFQSGKLQDYALYMLLAALGLSALFVYVFGNRLH